MRKHKPHWYHILVYYCPLCGGTKEYRERRYDERPSDYADRHQIVEVWDYCGAF